MTSAGLFFGGSFVCDMALQQPTIRITMMKTGRTRIVGFPQSSCQCEAVAKATLNQGLKETRAKIARAMADHFAKTRNMVTIGSGAPRGGD
jgi:hypothetical protein